MSQKLLNRIFSAVAAFSLLVNSFSAPLAVYAQDITPEATPVPTETPTSTPTVTATPVETQTPQTPTPTPSISVSPEEPSPTPTETQEQQGTVDAATVPAEPVAEEPTSYPEPDLSEPQTEGTSAELVPSVSTDKADYSPTDTVLITGADFAPNTEYTIEITSDTGNYKFSDRVTSDESGNIFYSFQLDGTMRPLYTVEIKDDSGTILAATSFTDPNPSGDLDHCRNGDASNPENCADNPGSTGWENGNAGASNAHYAEGQSIPYRLVLTDLSIGTHNVKIEWDVKHSSKHAIDYITSPDRIFESVLPCSGISGCTEGVYNTFSIPAPSSAGSPVPGQPTSSFNALTAAENLFRIYNGNITAMSYVSEGDLSAAQSSSQISIDFNATSSTVVLSWGGHIASRLDWGIGNSASGISGSPYHSRFIELDESGGNQDRSLSADAVTPPGNLTIRKEIVPDDITLWDFLVSGPDGYSNNIQDIGDGGESVLSVSPGTYTISETTNDDYSTSVSCNTGEVGSTSVLVDISSTENVICTFINTRRTGSITVQKNVDNNNDGDVTDPGDIIGATDWTWDITGGEQNIATGQSRTLPTGSYTISEDGKTSYHPVGWSCSNQTSGTGDTFSITFGDNEDVTCTFTNAQDTGTLTFIKSSVNQINPSDWTFDVDGPGSNDYLNQPSGTTLTGLPLGIYTITELTALDNYHFVSGSGTGCSFGDGTASVNIGQNGDTFTCTFTNAPDNGSISGHKYHDKNANGQFDGNDTVLENWRIFLDDGDGVFEDEMNYLTNVSGEYLFNNLTPGSYKVCEVLQDGWTPIVPEGCYDVTVGPGDDIANKDFFNFQNIKISGFKFEDMNGDGDWDEGELPLDGWTINLGGAAIDSAVTGAGDRPDGYYEFTNLGPGDYTVAETLLSLDWLQTAGDNLYNITAIGGQDESNINFGNFEYAKVWGYKYNDLNASGDLDIEGVADRLDGWEINLTGQTTVITSGGGYFEFTGLIAGDYTLSEDLSLQTGWTNSLPGTGQYLFTIQSGDILHYDFANWTQGSLIACKYDENERAVSGWEMTVTGGQLESGITQATDGEGCTTFELDPGTYTVTEEDNPDWVHTSPTSVDDIVIQSNQTSGPIDFYNARKATINIEKYNDLNGNGIDDEEPRLEGWHFTVYEGTCSELGTEVLSGNTDSDGELSGLLPAGDYCAVEDDSSHTGWVNTTSLEVDFSLSPADEQTILFGNQGRGTITIIKDVVPADSSQWSFNITGPNDYSDGTALGDDESQLFSPLAAGEYTIEELVGSEPYTTGVNCDNDISGETSVSFTLNPGDDVSCTFTNTANPGTISGIKWEDFNGDHDRDEGDNGLVEWQIFLFEDSEGELGSEIDNTFTGENGDYEFGEVGVGNYFVCEELPDGWLQTYPQLGEGTAEMQEEVLGPICWQIEILPGGEVIENDFGNFLLGIIGDFVWQDNNGDGIQDFGEPGISGVQADLYLDTDGTPGLNTATDTFVGSDTTDLSGLYEFTDLGPGTYWVDIVDSTVPSGLTLTTTDPYGAIEMVSGGNFDAADFGYEPAKGIQIEKSNDKSGGASAGNTVTYTLVVTNTGNVAISNVVVTDSLPGGFTYVTDSTSISGAPDVEPSVSGNTLQWSIGTVFPGEPVTIIYQATIASDMPVGIYKNYATCEGQIGGFLSEIASFLIDQSEPEIISCNTDDSDVPIGQTLSYGGKLTPQVLGASTELPATGSSTSLLLFALVVGGFGIFTKIKASKMGRRKYAKN